MYSIRNIYFNEEWLEVLSKLSREDREKEVLKAKEQINKIVDDINLGINISILPPFNDSKGKVGIV